MRRPMPEHLPRVRITLVPPEVEREGLDTFEPIVKNMVTDNNKVNFGIPETIVAGVPDGTGLLVVSVMDSDFHHKFRNNKIANNALNPDSTPPNGLPEPASAFAKNILYVLAEEVLPNNGNCFDGNSVPASDLANNGHSLVCP